TYEVPYMPWPPLVGIGLQLLLTPFLIRALGLEAIGIGTGNHGLVALGTTAIWMGLGLLIYYGYSRQKEEEKLEREAPTVDQLMRTAIDLARENDGEIAVMTVVTVPQQTPLSEGRQFIDEEREVIDRAMDIGEEADVPVSGTVRIGHDVSQAILNTIEHGEVDAVLLGWRNRPRREEFIFGSNVDAVITKARCDVLVERVGPRPDEVDEILLPIAGGPHAEFAAEVARAIASDTDATIHVVNVVAPGATDEEREEAEEKLDHIGSILADRVSFDQSIIEAPDVVDAVVERTDENDLTLIGATREGLFQQLLVGAIPEQIGERSNNTVIMAKRHRGITSRMKRWFRSREG
ncbi:MAG: universal stress protein, partial [Halanaeroarchaeum sp.]